MRATSMLTGSRIPVTALVTRSMPGVTNQEMAIILPRPVLPNGQLKITWGSLVLLTMETPFIQPIIGAAGISLP